MTDTTSLYKRYFEQSAEALASQLKNSLSLQDDVSKVVTSLGRQQIIRCLERLSLANEVFANRYDAHGRFDEKHISGNITRPEVNEIISKAGLSFKPSSFKVVFTHDIDWVTPWHFFSVFKSLKNTLTGTKNNWLSLSEHANPGIFYETIERFLALEKKYGVSAIYFLMSGPSGNGRYDTRYTIGNKYGKEVVKLLKDAGIEIGLHGSYYAREKNSYRIEKEAIEKVSGTKITAHRNHYLRFDPLRLPSQLEEAGITADYSVGYTSAIGFRSGYCSSYFMPDVAHSKISKVSQTPLILMERLDHLEKGEDFYTAYSDMLDTVKQQNGTVSILTHPENFVFVQQFWEFYERLMAIAVQKGAIVNMSSHAH